MASKLTPKPKFRSLCSLGNIPKIFMLGPTREPNLIGLGGGPVRDTFYKHLGVSTIGRLKTSIYNTISVSPSLHSSTPTPDQLLVIVELGSEFKSVWAQSLFQSPPSP